MRLRQKKQSDEATGIDISPLIDMVFILLIFFMVSSTFVKDVKLELERPGAQSSTPAGPKALRVHIDQTGDIYVDGRVARPWLVESIVRESLRSAGSKEVLVVSDRRIASQKLIEVVDACRLAGAAHVGVATDREAS